MEQFGRGTVSPEPFCQLLNLPRREAEGECAAKGFYGDRVAAGVIEEGAPLRLEPPAGAYFVERGEFRVDAVFRSEGAEDAQGKGVDGGDGGAVQALEGGLHEDSLAGPPGVEAFELAADAVAELGSGLVRESDGGQLLDAASVEDEGHVAVDEGARLAGPGARFDKEGLAEQLADQAALGFVLGAVGAGRGGHSASSPRAAIATCRQGTTAGSPLFCSNSRSRRPEQRCLKSQKPQFANPP